MSSESSRRRRHIARNVALVAGCFALAAAAGLFRNIVIARTFGIGADLDAYYAAFKLPDLLFTVVAGGALATAFIPVFADYAAAGDRAGAWRLASAVGNWVTVITTAAALTAGIAAPWLTRAVIAPGFTPLQQEETTTLMRLVLASNVIFGVSGVLGSVLNGLKHFLLPALAPVLYPLGIAAGAAWLAPALGVRGLALGAVLGATLHLAIKIPALIRYGFRWSPVLRTGDGAVRRVALLMGPRVLDLGVFHATMLATTNLASRLDAGSVSALEWGWDAMQLPETIIGTAFGLVAFPTLAELAARGDRNSLRATLGESLRTVLALAVPAAFGLILLGRPLLTLLYQRGAFDAAATEAGYTALRFYALGLTGHACLELAARTFFAQKDTVTPLLLAAASAGLNIALAWLLMGPLGHGGLALANSAAVTLEVLPLLLILRSRLDGVEGRETLTTLARVVAASLAMSGVVLAALRWLPGASALAQVTAGGAAGAAAYLLAARFLGVRQLERFLAALLGRV
ncbi:MAG: murein biosynthesis integral membrane protein MurJ [Anaerolineae bacterium]|nr:murein biosynthesis integral membrane protein MurJ [Anaerolineae bacterium]